MTAVLSSISGRSGKSSAMVPLIVEEYLPALTVTLVSFAEISTTSPLGRLEINSVRSLAGTVITPSSELETGRKSIMAMSKLVVMSETFLLSTRIRILFRMGKVALPIAIRLILVKALASLSCVTWIFILIPFYYIISCCSNRLGGKVEKID